MLAVGGDGKHAPRGPETGIGAGKLRLGACLVVLGPLALVAPAAEHGAPAPKVEVGPLLWHKRKVAIKTLVVGHREVGYVLEVPPGVEIEPVLAPKVEKLSVLAKRTHATAAINGSFFNRNDGVPASFIVAKGKVLADPRRNQALVGNPKLKPYLDMIFDRPEWRVWETPAGRQVFFERHGAAAPPEWKLIHAMQAGPLLLPELRLDQGAYLRAGDDGISSRGRVGRSAIGRRSDGYTLLVCLPKPPSPGYTIRELQDLLASFGAVSGMALDGGDAAGLVLKPTDPKALWWGHDAPVRSALIVRVK